MSFNAQFCLKVIRQSLFFSVDYGIVVFFDVLVYAFMNDSGARQS